MLVNRDYVGRAVLTSSGDLRCRAVSSGADGLVLVTDESPGIRDAVAECAERHQIRVDSVESFDPGFDEAFVRVVERARAERDSSDTSDGGEGEDGFQGRLSEPGAPPGRRPFRGESGRATSVTVNRALQPVWQVAAFARKEATEVLRQPRLLLTMVLGPFLVLAAFGLHGY
ncbi:MAG: hypothetical protein R2715_23310 [Ilumatobacteraceae bacterium]